MPERQLVHQSERRTTQDRNLAAGLQPAASAQFVGLLAARRVCTDTSGDERMRKTSTWLLSRELKRRPLLQTSSPLKHELRTHIGIGTANGGTSTGTTPAVRTQVPLPKLWSYGP